MRLLTLTGPGGIGKTRLALQAAAELLDDDRDGVFSVSLAPIHDPQFGAAAIAQARGIKEVADRPPAEQLQRYVREKQLLLLLDNSRGRSGRAVRRRAVTARQMKVDHQRGICIVRRARTESHRSD